MSTFITSDLHGGHSNIIKYCQRPWLRPDDLDDDDNWVSKEIKQARADEMDDYLVNAWNSVVDDGDDVWVCGDMCFGPRMGDEGNIKLFVERLKGNIHLIKGNHDHATERFWNGVGVDYYKNGYHIINGVMLSHYPSHIERRPDFTDSLKMQRIKLHVKRVYRKNKCRYLIYGHTHRWTSPEKKSYNACVDVNNFHPIEVNFYADNVEDIVPVKYYQPVTGKNFELRNSNISI